jgi:hypothetical protein
LNANGAAAHANVQFRNLREKNRRRFPWRNLANHSKAAPDYLLPITVIEYLTRQFDPFDV